MLGADTTDRYYLATAAVFARGKLRLALDTPPEQAMRAARRASLRLDAFRRELEFPRVQRALELVQCLAPDSLVDVGSGRRAFLWPLLETFPDLPVLSVERDIRYVAQAQAVRRGGLGQFAAARMDAQRLALHDGCVDGVTILEVLEHVRRPDLAAAEALRIARQFVLVSVPSKPDDNPAHRRLFSRGSLKALLLAGGARMVTMEDVPGNILALAVR